MHEALAIQQNIDSCLLLEGVRQSLARVNMGAFVQYTKPDYEMGWVHELICDELDKFLQDVIDEKSPRLIITMPPRHGKSELATRRFPAYALGRYPDLSFICASYSSDLSSMMNRDVQRVIESPLYRSVFPGTTLFGKNIRTVASGSYLRNSDIFEVVGHSGVYRSAGVGGGITGMGANIAIIDDPVKDRKEADSKTYRNSVYDWYTSTLYTRLAPGGGVILIMTRWHMDDLAGRLIAKETQNDTDSDDPCDTWRVVHLEAIASADEEHRKAGEALHPARYPIKRLSRIRYALPIRDWEALYQGKPIPDGGAIFQEDWLKYWTPDMLPAKWDELILSWDMTFKDTDGTDYVVGQVWGRKGADAFLLDQVRKRMAFTETVKAFVKMVNIWPKAGAKYIEDKANGPAVIDALKKVIPGLIPVEPDGSKIARAYAASPYFESGNVYIPAKGIKPWTETLKAEILQFPGSTNDDQVDAMTQAVRKLLVKTRRKITINPNFFGGTNG